MSTSIVNYIVRCPPTSHVASHFLLNITLTLSSFSPVRKSQSTPTSDGKPSWAGIMLSLWQSMSLSTAMQI